MTEEPGEPSDGMTQPSREKPPWVRLLWLLLGFLLVLVGSLPWLSTVLPQWGTMLRQWGTILWQWCLGSWQWVLFLLLRLSGFLLLLKVVWPWLSTVLPQWGKKLSQKRKAAGRWCKEWMGGLPLFAAIAIWAVLGIIAFLLAMCWLGRVPFWQLKLDPEKQAENIVKIALTLVGGVGAVAYLVIKYQERQQAGRAEKREKDRTVDTKMQDAINQLGSDKASTRIAGVYALTDIADRYKDSYRQRVVDILCGYLRSDRSSYAPDRSGQPVWDASGHLVESAASDEAVESTILSVMHDRLRKERKDETGETIVRQTVDDDQLWCACTFDLHEATFHEAVDLTDSTFECVPCFRGTKFERRANFGGAHFAGYADFRGAHFAGYADFGGAHFAGGAVFVDATFARYADFSRATFTGDAYFGWATFARGADFGGAEFRASAAFLGIQGQPSLGFKECKFNEISRGAYEWGPIPIPEDNDGLPAGAMWKDFLKEDDKDGGTTNR